MTKLFHIGEYIIHPDNIAYMRIWDDGVKSIGTEICFNAYAAAANEMNHGFEPLRIFIMGKTPVEIKSTYADLSAAEAFEALDYAGVDNATVAEVLGQEAAQEYSFWIYSNLK